ncbi:hypothetical protein Tco_0190503 [Tanacetum coccineum]
MLAIPHLSQVSSMAKIDSKEAQMKSKAGICFGLSSHNKHTSFLLSKEAQAASPKTSAINRAFWKKKGFVTHDLKGYEFEKTRNNNKSLSEIQLEHEKKDEFVVVVVKEIVNKLLEEVEVSLFGEKQDINDEGEEDEEGDGGSEA